MPRRGRRRACSRQRRDAPSASAPDGAQRQRSPSHPRRYVTGTRPSSSPATIPASSARMTGRTVLRMRIRLVALVAAVAVAASCSSTTPSKRAAATSTSTTAAVTDAPTTTTTTAPATTITVAPASSTTTTAAAVAASRPPAPAWRDCGNGFQCATLPPPFDYAHPGGPTVNLAVIRLRASGPAAGRVGALFVNPGGPGASAVDQARGARNAFSPAVLSRFDVVGFDPRGSGSSDPVSCEDGPGLDRFFAADPTPDDAAERQHLFDEGRDMAETCAARNGNRIQHVDTITTARDMDFVRASLGEEKVTYAGYSYGTFLGAMYADMFPTRVRAAVLDGAVDPKVSALQTSVEQAAGFQQAFNAFLADCTADPGCALHADGDPRAAYDRLRTEVETRPIAVGTRSVGPGEFLTAVASALYSQQRWPVLASALHAGLAGRGATLLSLFDALTQRQANGNYSPLFSAFYATSCLDRPAPTDPAEYDRAAAEADAKAPDFGAFSVYGLLVCAYWKVPPVDHERALRAAGPPPILVIGTTDDPATPYKWAQGLAGQLEKGVLVTRVGEGHTSAGSANSCVTAIVDAYLVNETVPAKRSC